MAYKPPKSTGKRGVPTPVGVTRPKPNRRTRKVAPGAGTVGSIKTGNVKKASASSKKSVARKRSK